MKDGRTHLAHKAEHAVDLETGAIVSVTVQGADRGDIHGEDPDGSGREGGTSAAGGRGIEEVVADKGYHSTQRMVDLDAVGLRCERTEAREATLARRPASAYEDLSGCMYGDMRMC